jgi:enediyne biosynthesis protein E4
MGVDAGDVNGDGRLDLVKTNFAQDYTSLYLNQGDALFVDSSQRSGLTATMGPYLGWGVGFVDVDNDGLLDLFIANGHVYPDVERTGTSTYRQRNQLLRNVGRGQYRLITKEVGGPLLLEQSSRGAAFGDVDNDGDTDVVVANDSGPIRLLVNHIGNTRHWVGVRVVGRQRRDMVGARVGIVRATGPTLWRRSRADGSYASANDSRVLFGLGDTAKIVKVRVQWPGGNAEDWTEVPVDRYVTLREGEGR